MEDNFNNTLNKSSRPSKLNKPNKDYNKSKRAISSSSSSSSSSIELILARKSNKVDNLTNLFTRQLNIINNNCLYCLLYNNSSNHTMSLCRNNENIIEFTTRRNKLSI